MTHTITHRHSHRPATQSACRALANVPAPSAPRTPIMLMAATYMGGPLLSRRPVRRDEAPHGAPARQPASIS